jgi:hypothetical protein
VVVGQLDTVALSKVARVQFLSGTVQPVLAMPDGTVLVGAARVLSPNIPAANGLLHVIGGVLTGDMAINSTSVAVAARMGDFGPFNKTKVGRALHACASIGCVPDCGLTASMLPWFSCFLCMPCGECTHWALP